MSASKSFFKRLGRSLLAVIVTGAVVKYTGDEKYILFAPLIQAGAKFLRDKFSLTLPF